MRTLRRSEWLGMSVISFFILTATVSLNSCGGGGGGGGSSLPSIALKTSNVRIEQPNDSWSYSVSGTYTYAGSTYHMAGTINSLITTSTKTSPANGVACNVEYDTANITVNSTPKSSISYNYFTQDADGNYFYYGESDGINDVWITSTTSGFRQEIMSPMNVGDSLSNTVSYTNGDTETLSYFVAGKEYASTSTANYESYKVNVVITTNYASGTYTKKVDTITAWIVPGLDIVKENYEIQYYINSSVSVTYNYTRTLTATNVVY